MSSVYRKDDQHVEKPKRNVYSKTFSKSLSARFGELIPVFCQPVMNGESVSIKHQHNFNFLPLVFPVQTNVRASLQYYYVRTRNIWKEWKDFQFKMKPNLVPPYLKFNQETKMRLLRVGGPLDNIGVPVVLKEHTPLAVRVETLPAKEGRVIYNPYTSLYEELPIGIILDIEGGAWDTSSLLQALPYDGFRFKAGSGQLKFRPFRYPLKPLGGTSMNLYTPEFTGGRYYFLVRGERGTNESTYSVTTKRQGNTTSSSRRSSGTTQRGETIGSRDTTTTAEQTFNTLSLGLESKYFVVRMNIQSGSQSNLMLPVELPDGYAAKEIFGYYVDPDFVDDYGNMPYGAARAEDYVAEGGIHVSDLALRDLPYANIVNDNDNTIRLSSLPLRVLESVYNSHIRHSENNPLMINGVPEYNEFLEVTDGGADTFDYPTRYANWQDDQFTTALHSPQHGTAPLVGLTANQGVASVVFANEDGTKTELSLKADEDGIVTAVHGAAANDEYTNTLSNALDNAVSFGISINDFRNVNSFQRWLENNVRKGYKYRDQIKAHWGVSVKFNVLDMPEYLGGTSRDMNVTQVTQTTENDNGVLGDYAGQAWIEGGSKHSINKFCDEDGFIIGILSIMPMASYSQAIPKWLMRESAFDWFSPEFAKIGLQPILNREISPLGSYYEGNGQEVFGYQRPFYDLLDNFDTIHGKFRTQFRNFILTRSFENVPTLSKDFLTYNPDQLNNIFYVDDDEDKILGQIRFEYSVRIPIPLYGIPALE